MKLNRKWLNEEYVDLSGVPDREFVETMTIAGQKVETYERLDAELRNVVVGRVVSITRHTNSDHMWVCQIDVGAGEPVQIVTGAQNVHEGDLVPVAQHNSWLPGGVHITKGKLRGEVSNGMLCSLKELGLTLNDFPYAIEDGIWILQEDCKPGDDINTVIGNDDTVVDFEITNNRPDCYSILGLAREAAAAFNKPMGHHDPVVRGGAAGELSELLEVEVPAEDLCRRYTARMVRNVKIAPSPKWLRQRLRANGVRPINNIVDITNYVMLEYGQPMHAFDYRYVGSGKIIVRRSEPGEALTTLDGNVRTLTPGRGTGTRAPLPRAVLHPLSRKERDRAQREACPAAGGQERVQLLLGLRREGVLQPHHRREHQPSAESGQRGMRLQRLSLPCRDLRHAEDHPAEQRHRAQPRDHLPPLELVPFGRQPQRFHHRGIHHHREQGFTNHQKVTDMKKIRKSFWRAYWKLHDKKKMLVARLKGYLDGLPPKTRKRIVLTMLAAFTVLALYTFGKAVYDIGRNDGSRMVTDHAGQVELSVKPDNNHNVIPYLYGTDEE